VNKEQAKLLWETDLNAGYPPEEAKSRLAHFAQTGVALPDPTAKYWPALVHQESRGNQDAVSPKGATGVAQVMPATGPEAAALAGLGWDPVAFKKDPVYNAKLGRAYFRKQMADNDNDPALALAAYNAGPGALKRAGGDLSKLPQETQDYVPAIMSKADQGMQQDLDNPQDVAQAQAALMSPRDQARKIYEDTLANGGSAEEAKAAIAHLARPQAAPTPQQAAPAAQQQGPNGVTGSWADEEPTFAQGLQNDIEKVYSADPAAAGQGRAIGGMIQGVRKLYNQAIGDTDKVNELNADEQRSRDFWNKVEPPGSGFSQADLGNLTGNVAVGALAPEVGGPSALAQILRGVTTGGAQGLIQPTTANESQAVNAGIGAGVGGVLSAAGAGGTRLLGARDEARSAAAEKLRAQGIDIPAGQDYNSPISTALRKLGGESGSGPVPEKSLTADLASKMGMPSTDITNEALEANLRRSGQAIGSAHANSVATPDRQFFRNVLEAGRKYQLSGPVSRSDEIMQMVNHLLERAKPGSKITGEEYQALRTGLTTNSVTGTPAQKGATTAMRRALDDMFETQNPKPELAGLRSQYRVSKILRNGSGIPSEGITAKQLRNRIESAAGKGQVAPEVRELLNETNMLMPKARIGGDAVLGADDNVSIRGLERPGIVAALMAATRGISGPLSKFYDKGTVQSIVNNQPARTSLANLLRGGVIPQATPKESNNAP
jgi:hypothetical protein